MKTTKQEIRHVSLLLFADRGYEAVSVRDIAEALSLSKGALYRHYTDKRAILDAIIEHADITASLPAPRDPAALTDFGKAAFERLTEGETAALFRFLTVGQYGDPVLSYAYEKMLWQLPLSQVEGALGVIPDTGRNEWALLFWSPLLALAGRYAAAADKTVLTGKAAEHCRAFAARLLHREEERQAKLLLAASFARRPSPFASRGNRFSSK